MHDIDFIVGAILEKPRSGSMVGPSTACIIGDSFYRFRAGDRFFYDILEQPGSFTIGIHVFRIIIYCYELITMV